MIKNFFKKNIFSTKEQSSRSKDIDEIVNITALLIEASSIDGFIENMEIVKIKEMVSRYFKLDKNYIDNYYDKAKSIQSDSTSFHNFTSKINQHYNYKQKLDIVQMLWSVVLADGVEHDFESNLIRRVCGLLHIKDVDSGRIKKVLKNQTQ